jgi:hypothetical protein
MNRTRLSQLTLVLALLASPAAWADAKDDAIALARDAQSQWRGWTVKTPTVELVEPYPDGYGESIATLGRNCVAAIDAAVAAGAPASTSFDKKPYGTERGTMTFAEARPLCEQVAAFGDAFEKLVDEREGALRAQIVAKYEAAGAKGERLAFLVEWDSVYFYRKGCQYVIEDAAELATAKVLFHWLENPDGTHTIRKYTLKGDKLKSTSEKTYDRVSKAHAGCK